MRLLPTSLTQRAVDPNNPTGGMTIDALRLRQKALQEAAPQAPAQIASPWQGAAFLANSFVNDLQQKQATAEEAAGRQKLAQLMGGIDMASGATPQQLADIGSLDPEMETKLFADAMSARRAKAEREAGYVHEADVDKRELGQEKDREQREIAARGRWEPDPADPTKYTNTATGEVKYIEGREPTETWKPDPANPNKYISNRGDVKFVEPKDPQETWAPDPANPGKLVSSRGDVKYVDPKETWKVDPADASGQTLVSNLGDRKVVKAPDKYVDDPNNPGVQINQPTGERKYPPSKGITYKDAQGNTISIGGPGGGDKLTEVQGKTANFLTRATGAAGGIDKGEKVLTELGPRLPGLAFGRDSEVGQMLGNTMASPEYQVAKRDADEFVTVFLRGESGATVLPSEILRYDQLFIPQPGDGPEKIAAKRRARSIALDAMSISLGSSEQEVRKRIDETMAKIGDPNYQPSATPAAPAPAVASAATPAPAAPAPAPTEDQFQVGKSYTDAEGNKATYLGGGKWREE